MTRFWISILLVCWAAVSSAQQIETTDPIAAEVAPVSSILTLDIDRLFSQSQFGLRILNEYTMQGEALAAENRRIAEGLREEELALADQRAGMATEVFLAEAEAFDEKAQAIRRAQDAKERDLETLLTEGRDQFLALSQPILGELMVDMGASAILDRRSALLSLSSIDITDDAIAMIDAQVGDGAADDAAQDDPSTAADE